MVAKAKPLIEPNAQNHYDVGDEDLPLSCPMPQMYLWNSHPRVDLPIEESGWAKCPYCGADGLLVREETTPQHIAWAREWQVPRIGIDAALVEEFPDEATYTEDGQ